MWNCEHDAPKNYCGICNTEEDIQSRMDILLECPSCICGIEYHHDPHGDWESKCRFCDGTGMLDKEASQKRHKFLAYYWKKKTDERRK